MAWFSVTTTIRSDTGANVMFAFRTDEAATVEDFADTLANNGVIAGDRFRVNSRRGEFKRLDERREAVLTREGVAYVTAFDGVERFEVLE